MDNPSWVENYLPSGNGILSDYDCTLIKKIIIKLIQSISENDKIIYKEEGLIPNSGGSYIFGDIIIRPDGTTSLHEDNRCEFAETGYTAADYGIDETIPPQIIAQQITDIVFNLLPSGKAIILFVIRCMALFYESFRDSKWAHNITQRFITVLVGPSGVRKTACVNSIFTTTHVDKDVIGISTSSISGINTISTGAYSTPINIEDLKPDRKSEKIDIESIKNFEFAVRSCCDKGTVRKTSRNAESAEPISSTIIATSEEKYWSSMSTILRTIEIQINANECDLDKLTILQEHPEIINNFLFNFLKFGIKNDITSYMGSNFINARKKCVKDILN